MNLLGLVIIATGLVFLIYSVIWRNKVNIYNRDDKYVITNMQQFLILQLWISVINSVILIILGFTIITGSLPNIYGVASPLLFHLINYITIIIGRKKQYIKIDGEFH